MRTKQITGAAPRAWAAAGMMMMWTVLSATPAWAQGEGLFNDYCAVCHADEAVALSRAPDRATLRQLSPEIILDAMTNGTMVSTPNH